MQIAGSIQRNEVKMKLKTLLLIILLCCLVTPNLAAGSTDCSQNTYIEEPYLVRLGEGQILNVVLVNDECPKTVNLTWTLSDSCDNHEEESQTVTLTANESLPVTHYFDITDVDCACVFQLGVVGVYGADIDFGSASATHTRIGYCQ
jgi:hypothetical protein